METRGSLSRDELYGLLSSPDLQRDLLAFAVVRAPSAELARDVTFEAIGYVVKTGASGWDRARFPDLVHYLAGVANRFLWAVRIDGEVRERLASHDLAAHLIADAVHPEEALLGRGAFDDDLRALEDQQARVEMDAILARSSEDRVALLLASGMDPEKAHREANAMLAAASEDEIVLSSRRIQTLTALHGSTIAPPAVAMKASARPGSPPTGLVIAAAATVTAILVWQGPALVARWHGDRPESADDGRAQAAKLRDAAFIACSRNDWATCRSDLDQAKSIDPAGDTTPQVATARQALLAATTSEGH